MNKKKQTLSQWLNKNSTAGVVCTLPFIIGFALFMIVPMGMSLYYAFCDYNIISPPTFSGLKNFQRMLTDTTFWTTLQVTFKFAFISVPLKLLFALIVALLLFKGTKMTGIYRAMYYLPSIIGGSVAVAVLWKRMFSQNGSINSIFMALGIIDSPVSWLGNTQTALWTLIILAVWQFGSSMLIFLSALKQIPTTLYEAARVDGANGPKQFFRITLPLITPNIHFNLVMQLINGFLAFTQCYIITQGKPLNSTLLYTVYMYQQSFEFGSAGYGAAMAWVMLLLIGLITLILFATRKFWVYDGGF
ncbi:MAG: sugar ABC transporter permease [Lachnospiraceae bacterium]|nr:sugar ABC transporter permease [Lachnospiraceae bacterium]